MSESIKQGGDYLLGLEYALNLFGMQHIELAEKLGIKKQNINMWIKKKQNIPKKYLPLLEGIFGINGELLLRDITEIEKLEIQREKLKNDLEPIVMRYERRYSSMPDSNLTDYPVYDMEEMNRIDREIEKAKLVSRFEASLNIVDDNPFTDTYKLIVDLLEKAQQETLLHKTVEALSHYLEVLPDGIASSEEQSEYENEIFEIFDDHNY